MEHSVWYEIKKQREEVIDQPPGKSVEELRNGVYNPECSGYFKTVFESSNPDDNNETPTVPLSYYTKPSAWAADYPLTHRRVMVYLNPWHLASDSDLNEYLIREFGCTRETFKQFVKDGWFIVELDTPDMYNRDIYRDIENLFNDISGAEVDDKDILPRYINLPDLALGVALAESGAENENLYVRSKQPYAGEYVDIDQTKKEQLRSTESPWDQLSTEGYERHGVEHDSHREYITERVLKLQLAVDVLGESITSDTEIEYPSNIYMDIKNKIGKKSDETLSELTYATWNLVGAPIYYCDLSGTTDMGKGIAKAHSNNSFIHTITGDSSSLHGTIQKKLKEVRLNLKSVQTATQPTKFDIPVVGDEQPSTLFSISPVNNDASFNELKQRAEAHESLYKAGRDRGVWHRSDDDKYTNDTRDELRESHNEDARTAVEGESQMYNAWDGIQTQAKHIGHSSDAAAILASLAGIQIPPGSSLVAATVGTLAEWDRKGQTDAYIKATIPRPESVSRLDEIGQISHWGINYNTPGQEQVATDGGKTEDEIKYVDSIEVQ